MGKGKILVNSIEAKPQKSHKGQYPSPARDQRPKPNPELPFKRAIHVPKPTRSVKNHATRVSWSVTRGTRGTTRFVRHATRVILLSSATRAFQVVRPVTRVFFSSTPSLGRYKIPWQFCGIWTIKKERNYDKMEIKKRPISCYDKEYFEAVDLCIRCCLCGLDVTFVGPSEHNVFKEDYVKHFHVAFTNFWRETRRIRKGKRGTVSF